MEEIKIKVKCKQLDGSIVVADTTINSSNQFNSENSVEPNPNAGYTKTEADQKFAEKISNGFKIQIPIIPESLKMSVNREATEEEIEWIENNKNSFAYSWGDEKFTSTQTMDDENQIIISGTIESDPDWSSGDSKTGKYYALYYGKADHNVEVIFEQLDNYIVDVVDLPASLSIAIDTRRTPTDEERDWIQGFDSLYVNHPSYGRIPVTNLQKSNNDIKISLGYNKYDNAGNVSESYQLEIFYDYIQDEVSTIVYDY